MINKKEGTEEIPVIIEATQIDFRRIVRNRERIIQDPNYQHLRSPLLAYERDGASFHYPMGIWLKAFDAGKLELYEHLHLVGVHDDKVLLYDDRTERLEYRSCEDAPDAIEEGVDWLKELKCPFTLGDEWKVAFQLLTELDEFDRLDYEHWQPSVTPEDFEEYEKLLADEDKERVWMEELYHHDLLQHDEEEVDMLNLSDAELLSVVCRW